MCWFSDCIFSYTEMWKALILDSNIYGNEMKSSGVKSRCLKQEQDTVRQLISGNSLPEEGKDFHLQLSCCTACSVSQNKLCQASGQHTRLMGSPPRWVAESQEARWDCRHPETITFSKRKKNNNKKKNVEAKVGRGMFWRGGSHTIHETETLGKPWQVNLTS